jgi:hypothetical protein
LNSPKEDSEEGSQMDFVIGQAYTRAEISRAIGGEKITYLPQRDHRIVCGCFIPTQSKNPNAPDEVLVGTGPLVEKKAEMLCGQDGIETTPALAHGVAGNHELEEARCMKRSTPGDCEAA